MSIPSRAPAPESESWRFPHDPLGAFCRENHAALAGSDSGPLAGLTFGVKDLFHVAGTRTGFGQPDWLRTHGPERETAPVVRDLLDAGADMVGKTITDELAYSITGQNVHYGTPVNPCDPSRTPGGSSSGSASAVAGGLVDFALGSDCGGSVRIPASYCGILGLRPTHGRVSIAGAQPFAPSFDVVGWFARSTAVFEALAGVLLGDDSDDVALRRLVRATDAFALLAPAVAAAFEPAVELAAAQVESVREAEVSPDGLPAWSDVFRTLQAAEVWQNLGPWVSEVGPELGPGIKERFELAARVTPAEVDRAAAQRRAVIARLEELLQPGDVLCLPSAPRVAPLISDTVDAKEIEYRNQAMWMLCIAGLGGLPQVSLPLAAQDGLPLGLSLIGPRGSDRRLVDLGVRICAAQAR